MAKGRRVRTPLSRDVRPRAVAGERPRKSSSGTGTRPGRPLGRRRLIRPMPRRGRRRTSSSSGTGTRCPRRSCPTTALRRQGGRIEGVPQTTQQIRGRLRTISLPGAATCASRRCLRSSRPTMALRQQGEDRDRRRRTSSPVDTHRPGDRRSRQVTRRPESRNPPVPVLPSRAILLTPPIEGDPAVDPARAGAARRLIRPRQAMVPRRMTRQIPPPMHAGSLPSARMRLSSKAMITRLFLTPRAAAS